MRLAALTLIPLLFAASASASMQSELQACAEIEKDKARLACFDALVEDAAGEVAEPGRRQLTDEVGRKKTHKEIVEESYDVSVAECEKINNRVYFRLANGQVWRQSNSRWMSLRNCEGPGTIKRDFWGYQLTIDAMDSTVRVNRAK